MNFDHIIGRVWILGDKLRCVDFSSIEVGLNRVLIVNGDRREEIQIADTDGIQVQFRGNPLPITKRSDDPREHPAYVVGIDGHGYIYGVRVTE